MLRYWESSESPIHTPRHFSLYNWCWCVVATIVKYQHYLEPRQWVTVTQISLGRRKQMLWLLTLQISMLYDQLRVGSIGTLLVPLLHLRQILQTNSQYQHSYTTEVHAQYNVCNRIWYILFMPRLTDCHSPCGDYNRFSSICQLT